MAELNLKPKKIDLFSDDRAFDLMTTAADETDVNITAGLEKTMAQKIKEKADYEFENRIYGEVSSWNPSGMLFGMKTPRGFGAMWDMLTFGAVGGPGLVEGKVIQDLALLESAKGGARWTRNWNRHPLVRERRGLSNVDSRLYKLRENEEMAMQVLESHVPKSQRKLYRKKREKYKNKKIKEISEQFDIEESELTRLERPYAVELYNKPKASEAGYANIAEGKIFLNKPKFKHDKWWSDKEGKWVDYKHARSVGVHEGDHLSFRYSEHDSYLINNAMSDRGRKATIEYYDYSADHFAHAIGRGPKPTGYKPDKGIMGGQVDDPLYLLRDHEIHARIMQLREKMGWKTFDDIPDYWMQNPDKVKLPKEIKESFEYKNLTQGLREDKIGELIVSMSGLAPVALPPEDMLLEFMKEPDAGVISEYK